MTSPPKLQRHAESAPAVNTATLTARGPAHLCGDLALMARDGSVALRDTRMVLCRCGGSRNKPFCDGSHAKREFTDDGGLRAGEVPSVAAAGGRLEIRARPDGPLMLTGPLTVIGTNGRAASGESTFLCRCGATGNKPYCDGTHKKIGFAG
jgi:CDGSH-type Zn-finger protein